MNANELHAHQSSGDLSMTQTGRLRLEHRHGRLDAEMD
jgi:hypothetical protein